MLVSLTIFDIKLRSDYITLRDKGPFGKYKDLKFRAFDSIDLRSSSISNVKIVQGPYKVLIDPEAMNRVHVKQNDETLSITADFEGDYYNGQNMYMMVISCPKLAEFKANAIYTKNKGEPVIDTIVRDEWRPRQNLIEGFTQDSLSIVQDHGSLVLLSKNNIRALTGTLGISPLSGSRLIILNNNKFENVTLGVLNRSRLKLNGDGIKNIRLNLADSAKMELTGSAKNILYKLKPYNQ